MLADQLGIYPDDVLTCGSCSLSGYPEKGGDEPPMGT